MGVAFNALKDGVVLTVGGEQAHAVALGSFDDKSATEHEELFVGQCDVFASFDRGEGGFEATGADHGDEHDIRLGQSGDFEQACIAAVQLGTVGEVATCFGCSVGGFAGESGMGYVKLCTDCGELIVARVSRDADKLEAIRVGSQNT